MTRLAFLLAASLCVLTAHARDIRGSITTTLTITDDSQFVGDASCGVERSAVRGARIERQADQERSEPAIFV